METEARLDSIFKAYDIRGLVPAQLDEATAARIGAAFASFSGADRIAVGRDCRLSSPALAAALIAGITGHGTGADDLGMITTDMVYFAAGSLNRPGAMVTASHNPQGWNGIKLCLPGAAPVGAGSGLEEVRRLVEDPPAPAGPPGEVRRLDVLSGYVDHLLSIVDASRLAGLRVAADGGNGVAGVAVPAVFDRLPADLIGLYLEPDGRFPNHHPDPLRPENLRDLEALMQRERPHLGVAFDGDADRAFFVDDALRPLPGSTVTAMVAKWFLRREPGSAVVHNLICSRAVPETILRAGGVPVRTRVGHSFIKGVMKETGAVFGGEHSGHYYYRDNYRADSGILTMLVLMQVLAEDGRPLSAIRGEFEPYAQSGEINLEVARPAAAAAAAGAAFADAEQDRVDGLTVSWSDRWFNLRPSNTEPVLRLNVEAPDAAGVEELVARVRAAVEEAVDAGA
ncbi:MAG: phosphomannomutase/phosphoglucomutase [Acidimicrobiia bacterium]|nr:phosphomannomutase/phosphoglucomutase [Acidimicrobiia bacterium]